MDLRLVDRPAFASSLFVCCMVCHGELVRLKPHPRYLTGFYVIVSLGGAVGGLFVGLVAPNLFHAYYEFPIGLALCALVAAIVFTRALWSAPRIWTQHRHLPSWSCCWPATSTSCAASCFRWWTATGWSPAISTASCASPTMATRASMTTPPAG